MLENYQRQDLYRFFARIFSYPDAALLETLPAELAAVSSHLEAGPPPSPLDAELDELEVGYTELFISRYGGVAAPPYGSVYLEEEQQLMGQTTLCVLRAYEGEGLSHEETGDPPDFIATEMEFLYFLVGQEMDALGRNDLDAAHAARQKQVDFCHTLLQPWVTQFCERILQTSDGHTLYRWAAEMLKLFCQHEERLHGV